MLKKLKKRSPFFALLKTMHGGEMNAMLAQSMEKKSKISLFKHNSVSYTHLTLPTICSV